MASSSLRELRAERKREIKREKHGRTVIAATAITNKPERVKKGITVAGVAPITTTTNGGKAISMKQSSIPALTQTKSTLANEQTAKVRWDTTSDRTVLPTLPKVATVKKPGLAEKLKDPGIDPSTPKGPKAPTTESQGAEIGSPYGGEKGEQQQIVLAWAKELDRQMQAVKDQMAQAEGEKGGRNPGGLTAEPRIRTPRPSERNLHRWNRVDAADRKTVGESRLIRESGDIRTHKREPPEETTVQREGAEMRTYLSA